MKEQNAMGRNLVTNRILGALALAALAVVGAGCEESASEAETFSGSAANTQASGPDLVTGEGNRAVDFAELSAGRLALGEKLADDATLSNGIVTIGIDAVGLDPSFTNVSFGFGTGVPLQNAVLPGGGNLVDISLDGSGNDQWITNALGVAGLGLNPGPSAYQPPENLVFWFDIIPDTSDRVEELEAVGLTIEPVRGETIRRLICRGVIQNTGGRTALNQALIGAHTASAGAIKIAVGSDPRIPTSFIDNVPNAFNILCFTSGGGTTLTSIPIFVTQIYTLFDGSSIVHETTVIQHIVPDGDPVSIFTAAEIGGVGAQGNASMDVTAGGPMWLDPITTVGAGLTGLLKSLHGLPNRPSVTAGELNQAVRSFSGGFPALPGDTYGRGAVPWVSFVGRGPEAVSYTLFDAAGGTMVFLRDPRQSGFGIALQFRLEQAILPDNSATDEDESDDFTSRLAWARKIAVGKRNDAASGTGVASSFMRDTTRVAALNANSIFRTVEIRGKVTNAPEGTVITVGEKEPTIFSNFDPTRATPEAPASQLNSSNNRAIVGGPNQPEFRVPLSATTSLSSTALTITTPVLRTTVRPNSDGEFRVVLPIGAKFQAIDPFDPFVPPTVFVDIRESTYVFTAVLPGGAAPVTVHAGLVVRTGDDLVLLDEVNLGDAVGFIDYEIRDENGALIPGQVTVLTAANGVPTTDFSLPTGIEEGLERTTISGNTAFTASGRGRFAVKPNTTFHYLASAGTDYDLDDPDPVEETAGPGETRSITFNLTKVTNAGTRKAVSADFHVHGGESSDSHVEPKERIRSLLAQGIEVYAQTDHQKIGNARPAISQLKDERPDVSRRIKHLFGEEFTTDVPWVPTLSDLTGDSSKRQCIGHINAYPLVFKGDHRKGGAPDEQIRPPAVAYAALQLEDGVSLTALPIFGGTGSVFLDTNEIVQMNHPRSVTSTSALDGGDGIISNFAFAYPTLSVVPPFNVTYAAAFGLNDSPASAIVPIQSAGIQFLIDGTGTVATQPSAFPGLGSPGLTFGNFMFGTAQIMRGTLGCDAIEVFNGRETETNRRFLQNRADWHAFLNRGVIKTAVGNSDCHKLDDRRTAVETRFEAAHVGIPRNYLLVGNLGPDELSDADIVSIVKPSYRTPSANPAGATAANPAGSLIPANYAADRMKVVVSTGPLVEVSVTGAGVTAATNAIGRMLEVTGSDVDVTVTITAPEWISAHVVEARLIINGSVAHTTSFSGSATVKSFTFNDVTLSTNDSGATSDSWMVVEVGQTLTDLQASTAPTGAGDLEKTYARIYPGFPVIAFTNPVFFDRDGDPDTFDAVKNDE